MDWILLIVLVVNVAFLAWLHERSLKQVQNAMTAALRDKAKLVELLKETVDRVQAADPTQYAMLRGVNSHEQGRVFHRSDADEARIAESRGNGL